MTWEHSGAPISTAQNTLQKVLSSDQILITYSAVPSAAPVVPHGRPGGEGLTPEPLLADVKIS
jgi:hypothetical protein